MYRVNQAILIGNTVEPDDIIEITVTIGWTAFFFDIGRSSNQVVTRV